MTKEFKTKSMILEKKMPRILGNNQFAGKTILAIDGGYSSVKGVSGNKMFIYPSYAKKVSESIQIVGQLKPNDILLRDNSTNTLWAIGSLAENMIDKTDLAQTTDESLYTRYRYQSEIYKAIMSAGIGIGLLDTSSGNEIYISTGLPSTYKQQDSEELKSVLSGSYDLSIKIGDAPYRNFKFVIKPENISIMEQPQGTLLASAYDKNGELLANGKDIISSNSIIYDVGFGTEDLFVIRGGINNGHKTYTDTGMKAVFEATIEEIKKQFKQNNPACAAEFKVFEFQKFLEDGKAIYFNRQNFATEMVEFESILRKKNSELCRKSIHRLMEEYDNLLDYKNLIITGGTGESRFEEIKDMLKGLSHLNIIRGNQNDDSLPFSFSNVRGYYIFQYLKLMNELRAQQ